MTHFLKRYLEGECEQVWAELVALGEQVQKEPLYSDVLAVARETARRARFNIETLIARLPLVGYEFGYAWTEEDEQDWVEDQPPLFALPPPDIHERLTELEQSAGAIPLSVRAWYEHVGSVNFVGIPPASWRVLEAGSFSKAFQRFLQEQPQPSQRIQGYSEFEQLEAEKIGLDPLQVWPIETQLSDYYEWQESRAKFGADLGEAFMLTIAPDHDFKIGIGGLGAYQIRLPCAASDAPLLLEGHHTTFVNYLRICFRWGGLPGLEHYSQVPEEDLTYLTKDLLPI